MAHQFNDNRVLDDECNGEQIVHSTYRSNLHAYHLFFTLHTRIENALISMAKFSR